MILLELATPAVSTGDDQADLKPGETITQGVKHTIHDHPAEPWGSMSLDLGNPPAWITADEDHLKILLKRSDANVRYFKDYSGWGPGQLDEELKVGGWLIGDANEDILFGSYDAAWETAVKQCGQKILDDIALTFEHLGSELELGTHGKSTSQPNHHEAPLMREQCDAT